MRWIRDNSLSLVLVAIFLASLAGQAFTGFHYENEQRTAHQAAALSFPTYLASGAFLSSVFENWESEFLEKAAYVVLTAVLIQRGSAESKDPDAPKGEAPDTPEAQKPWPARRNAPAPARWVYERSLGLALFALFVGSFVLHWLNSARAENVDKLLHGKPPEPLLAHLGSATLWFQSFQNWQSEFLSTVVLVLLSIWLRQKASPESKRIGTPDRATGR